jgi:DNA-binding SARP family transcriptional activator
MALRLRVLGGLCLTKHGSPVHGVAGQRRSLALLALLAVHEQRGLSRDKVCAVLWPNADACQARNRLKQAVYSLRRELGTEAILGTIQLRLGTHVVTCDLVDLRRELALGRPDRAVSLFEGQFLDGFHIGGEAEAFERWADDERRALARFVADILRSQADVAAKREDHEDARYWWRRLAALDPLDARYARGVAMAELAVGNRAGALQFIASYQKSVHSELELPIDPDLHALATWIRASTDLGGATVKDER